MYIENTQFVHGDKKIFLIRLYYIIVIWQGSNFEFF